MACHKMDDPFAAIGRKEIRYLRKTYPWYSDKVPIYTTYLGEGTYARTVWNETSQKYETYVDRRLDKECETINEMETHLKLLEQQYNTI